MQKKESAQHSPNQKSLSVLTFILSEVLGALGPAQRRQQQVESGCRRAPLCIYMLRGGKPSALCAPS